MFDTFRNRIRNGLRADVEDAKTELAVSERFRKNRSCVKAAAAYAWLASVPDDIFINYKYQGVLEPYMFAILSRLWPKGWDPKSLVIRTRRECLLQAAALILMELEELDTDAG